MVFLNVDVLGYEYRGSSGFSFLFAAGVSVILHDGHVIEDSCFIDCEGSTLSYRGHNGEVWPQFRIGFGYWF